ncbi:MAG: hypothetical protein QOI66_1675, partial [Myxococcales bacterium]|nr:hypothetical protein [Myxococcales bacterium]
DAYPLACTSITPTTQAAWVSAPVAVTLMPGVVPMVSFVLRPAGGVSGDVDFLFLAASPAAKVFPSLVLGQTSTVTFTVTNIGPATTGVLAASLTGTGANQFEIGTNNCGVALAPNGTCTIQATFAPTLAGATKPASVQLVGTPGGTLPITLSGTGVQPAVLALAPATQNFGTVGVGKSSPLVTYTVTNAGGTTTAPVTVTSSDAAFAVSGSTCTDALPQSGTCQVKVAFVPTAIAAKMATLTATAGTVTTTATVTGNGIAAPALTLTPSALDLGTVIVNEQKQMPFMLKNVGGFTLTGFTAYMGGMNGNGPFIIDDRICSMASLAPGATCPVNVTFQPDPSNTGLNTPVSATVLISAGGTNPASVMGTVSGIETWPLAPNPSSIDYGSVKVGTSSSSTVRFTNVASKPVGPLTVTVSPAVFTITSNQCNGNFQWAPGGFCDVVVSYTPTAAMVSVGGVSVAGIPNVTVGVHLHGVGTP